MVAELALELPRPVKAFHQIELTSRCNLRCVYCTHKGLGRDKIDMQWGTFVRAMVHVNYHTNIKLDQDELNLCGIGESTLLDNLVDYIRYAREVVGKSTFLNFTTNGILFTEELAKSLVPYMSSRTGHKPGVFVSLHRPEKAKLAIDLARDYGLLANVSNDPALHAINWAGQVDWKVTAPQDRPCVWLREGRVIVLSDGSVSTCCMDSAHDGVIGHVDDEPGTLKSKPYRLCASCDQVIGIKGYQQYQDGKRLPVAKARDA